MYFDGVNFVPFIFVTSQNLKAFYTFSLFPESISSSILFVSADILLLMKTCKGGDKILQHNVFFFNGRRINRHIELVIGANLFVIIHY